MDDFEKSFEREQKKYKRPNILICGYTGSGKSSLIKAILGDIVPDDAIGTGAPRTVGFDCYENKLVRIYDSRGYELGKTEEQFTQETRNFIRKCQSDLTNVDEHIHLVWYAIQGGGGRFTDFDKNLIFNIFNPQDVIVVITKTDTMTTRPGENVDRKAALKKVIMSAGIPEKRIVFTTDMYSGAIGCKELMNLSYEMLPEAYKDAFMDAQKVDKEAKIQAVKNKSGKATGIVSAAVASAGGVGAIPIPGSDAPILISIQMGMIAGLAALYGLREEAVNAAVYPMIAKVVGILAATSLSKLIPGLGSVIQATVAAALTGAMGAYVKNSFEQYAIDKINGIASPSISFDPDIFMDYYKIQKQK